MSGVAQGAPAYDAAMILKVVGCVVGVVGSLLVYGILQERIMTKPYDDGGSEESFTFSVFLVMNNRIVSMAVAVATLAWMRGAVQPVAPMYKYAAVSASNVVATTCQYEALKYVSFPVQTLGKCAKVSERRRAAEEASIARPSRVFCCVSRGFSRRARVAL